MRSCAEGGKRSSLSEELRGAVAARHESCQARVEHGEGAESASTNSCQARQEHRENRLSGKKVAFESTV